MNLTEIQARDAATDPVWFQRTATQSVTELAVRDRRGLLGEVERLRAALEKIRDNWRHGATGEALYEIARKALGSADSSSAVETEKNR